MPYGTVRWFNKKAGVGFIRTDGGKNVLFVNGAIWESEPSSIYRGARVNLDDLQSKYGLTVVNVVNDRLKVYQFCQSKSVPPPAQ
jgi:cold shock CspA family protein